MEHIPEGEAWFHSPRKLVELGWSPVVTVLYVVVSLATGGSLDYPLLAALIVLSVTCILYARRPPERPAARVEMPAEPPRIERPTVRSQAAAPVEPPKAPSEPPPAEPVKLRSQPPSPERQQENGGAYAAAVPAAAPAKESKRGQSAPLLTPEAPAAAAVLKQLDEAKAELERSRQNGAALEKEIAEQTRQAAERLEVVLAITGLKERARAIRRQWPDAAFCQRPLREQWWTPGSNQTASTSWLAKAHEWHSQFREVRPHFFPHAEDAYLRSLDLEEMIDFLDDIILSRETQPLHRETRVTAATAPVLVIKAWGAPEGEEEKCGFWIQNTGELPATNIQLARVEIASKLLSIYLPPSSVLTKEQQLFVIASLTGAQRATAYNLEDLMRKLPVNRINGAQPLGVGLRLIYDSKDGVRYASRHEMSLENNVIKVHYVNTELLAMPL
ncbi:MAG TPA: hypothetical protein VME43_27370 [Bryobacteraceae bacterium]|nr:hypothetical protein [Bryobacteraceae bacterium]